MLRAATKLTSTVKKSNGPSASLSDSFRQSTLTVADFSRVGG